MAASPNRTQGRVLEDGDLLQSQGGSGRDRRLARPRQSGSAALLRGLPATRARDPRRRPPPTHITDHAVVSQNSVQNPGQVIAEWRSTPDPQGPSASRTRPSGAPPTSGTGTRAWWTGRLRPPGRGTSEA